MSKSVAISNVVPLSLAKVECVKGSCFFNNVFEFMAINSLWTFVIS